MDGQTHRETKFLYRAGLTVLWALRTPQRRGPTVLDAKEGEGWEGVSVNSVAAGCFPSRPTRQAYRSLGSVDKLLSRVRGGFPAENDLVKFELEKYIWLQQF